MISCIPRRSEVDQIILTMRSEMYTSKTSDQIITNSSIKIEPIFNINKTVLQLYNENNEREEIKIKTIN